MKKKFKNILHTSFEVGLIIKAIDSLFEIIGGILLVFINPNRLNHIVQIITRRELYEDPNDKIMNLIVAWSHNFSMSAQNFGIIYLISHGVIKLVIVILLWKKKIWAYPFSIGVLVLFIIYQIYEYTLSGSIFLILLTFMDIIMIFLTIVEYRNAIKRF